MYGAKHGYKTRSALRVFKPPIAGAAAAAAAAGGTNSTTTYYNRGNNKRESTNSTNNYYYQPLRKTSKKTGKPGTCFEKHETAPAGRYFELGEGYYGYLGFYRNEIGLHIR